ncbi:hypothetical protein [Poseidonocella pacifica]|uniref:hypothetical protein n=1 Tax=Poseidonocella pacifica TaxID=871651 RepID=UPI000B89383A|nr:hypothetical protein [Poseidonocella pacifica]
MIGGPAAVLLREVLDATGIVPWMAAHSHHAGCRQTTDRGAWPPTKGGANAPYRARIYYPLLTSIAETAETAEMLD